jgi:DNA-binding CsgD family transcriptional regulator
VPRHPSPGAALTTAEQRIVKLVAVGNTNRVIAQQLWLSLHMVRLLRQGGVNAHLALVPVAAG